MSLTEIKKDIVDKLNALMEKDPLATKRIFANKVFLNDQAIKIVSDTQSAHAPIEPGLVSEDRTLDILEFLEYLLGDDLVFGTINTKTGIASFGLFTLDYATAVPTLVYPLNTNEDT